MNANENKKKINTNPAYSGNDCLSFRKSQHFYRLNGASMLVKRGSFLSLVYLHHKKIQ